MSALGGSELGVRGIIVCHLLRLSTFAGSWGLVGSRIDHAHPKASQGLGGNLGPGRSRGEACYSVALGP